MFGGNPWHRVLNGRVYQVFGIYCLEFMRFLLSDALDPTNLLRVFVSFNLKTEFYGFFSFGHEVQKVKEERWGAYVTRMWNVVFVKLLFAVKPATFYHLMYEESR